MIIMSNSCQLTLPHSIRGAVIWPVVLFSSTLVVLLHMQTGAAADIAGDSHPSSVPVGSSLPPEGSTNSVVLASPNGMFNLKVQAWRGSPASYCMAGVINVKIDPGSMLWGANNAQPLLVASTCRLFLSREGDLLLQYDGNNTAWQTHTTGMGVANLTLYDSGNLVLHTEEGLIVWQSFTQSPAFNLNSGMNLTSNITIFSSAPISNGLTSFSVPGSFAMQLHSNNLALIFTDTNDSSSAFVYWSTSFTPLHANSTDQVAYVALHDALTFYDNTSRALGSVDRSVDPIPPSFSSALRVALIDPPSANLLAFYRANHTWVQFYNSSIGACENPTKCGHFALCNAITGGCSCPPGFRQNAARDCEADTDLSFDTGPCSSALGSVDARLYSFVSVNVSFPPQLSAMPSPSIENCTSLCSKRCTCKVALFDPATSVCSLFSNLQTVLSKADSNQLMLLKIAAVRRHSSKTPLAAILGASIAASFCSICTLFAVCCCKRRRAKRDSSSRDTPNEEVFLQALPRLPPRYTCKELEAATLEFSTKLGAGGFGAVYEGVLPSGVKIAVKKLEGGSGQSSAQFRAEVASIGSVSHMNLVTLKGFCHEGEARLLVYEHMKRGSLERWLFGGGEEGGKELGWERRCKIAVDTAKGLAYLHHECGERIVHCDVKPENILLDEEFNAKVGDFGLAKLVGRERQSFAMTTLKGTRGYLAPEWLQDATITAKSDVYSFGVVLLELISGRRCLDSNYGYLPTIAFHIASMSSSMSSSASTRSSRFGNKPPAWKEGILFSSTPNPEPATGFPTSHEGAAIRTTEGKASLSSARIPSFFSNTGPPPPEPITGFPAVIYSSTTAPPNDLPQHAAATFHSPPQHSSSFDHPTMAAFLDTRLSGDCDVSPAALERMIFIGLWCVQPSPSVRPPMSVVVQMLEGVVDVPPPPLQTPLSHADEFFTSTSTSSSASQFQPLLLT